MKFVSGQLIYKHFCPLITQSIRIKVSTLLLRQLAARFHWKELDTLKLTQKLKQVFRL